MENLAVALDKISIDGSATKGLESNYCVSTICVEGYDTSIQRCIVKLELRKHFSSCGHVQFVYVPRDFERAILKRSSFIWIVGEDAEEKALELNGSDVGGWNVVVKPAPFQKEYSDSELAERFFKGRRSNHLDQMTVRGFDPLLPDIDVRLVLAKHFSSCGVIYDIYVNMSRAFIRFYGEGAVDKAMALNNACNNVGGWNLVVEKYPLNSLGKRTGFM